MTYSAKELADLLHVTLDDLSVPTAMKERSSILAKMIDIPKQDAWSLLEGHVFPADEILQKLVTELEIDIQSNQK